MNKLDKRLREVQDEHAEEFWQEHIDAHQRRAEQAALFVLGGIRAVDRAASALSSECLRALIRFQEEKRHEALGFERFADFLDESEYSPMSKAQFYERKAVLDKEGDIVFDLLNDLGVSIRKRKLLGKGNVELDGETVIIKSDGGEDIEIELTNRSRLLETITALADANLDKTAKLEKQKEKIAKHDLEKRELYDEIDRAKASKGEVSGDAHSMALANVGFAFQALRDEAGRLTETDRSARRNNVFEIIAHQLQLTREAYGFAATAVERTTALEGQSFGEVVDGFLENLELEDNDAELAASL